jgi:hypothetical protein
VEKQEALLQLREEVLPKLTATTATVFVPSPRLLDGEVEFQ